MGIVNYVPPIAADSPVNNSGAESAAEAQATLEGAAAPPSSIRQSRLQYFLESKFATPVITTLLTAVIGPILVVQVNSYIQNKAIQKEVIQTVLAHTNDEDFSKVQALEKIQVIASLVDENSGIFGLNFTKTLASIDEMKRTGYHTLSADLEESKIKETQLTTELAADKGTIQQAKTELQKLKDEVKVLETQRNNTRKMTAAQLAKLDEEIRIKGEEVSKKQTELTDLETKLKIKEEELSTYKAMTNRLENDLQQAQSNLNSMIKEKDDLNARLEQNKVLLATESQNAAALTEALKKTTMDWEKSVKDNEMLIRELTNSKLENTQMAQELATARTEAAKLQERIAALQKSEEPKKPEPQDGTKSNTTTPK